MEIDVIKLTNLRNEEHAQFQTNFNDLVRKYTPATLGIEPQYTSYSPLYAAELNALDVIRKSVLTDEIANMDTLRDTTIAGLKDAVSSAGRHYNADIVTAVKRVAVVFDSYGNICKRNYDAETAAISNLVSELQGNHAAALTTLGLTEWVQQLETQNKNFDALKSNRYYENAASAQQSMKLIRTDIDISYRAIVKRINALIEVNGETAYSLFVKELNERIAAFNILIAQRKGRTAVSPKTTAASTSGAIAK